MQAAFIIFLALLFSAFFSGMEIAFLSANRLRIELDKKRGLLSSGIVGYFQRNSGLYLVTILVGNNTALVIYGLMMSKILSPVLQPFVGNHFVQIVANTFLSTLIILFFAEFLPKAIFRVNPNRTLNLFAFPVFFFHVVLFPISYISMLLSNVLLSVVGVKRHKHEKQKVFGRLDLDGLVNEMSNSEAQVKIEEEHEIKIFRNALDFSKVKLRDCMVPRAEIVAVEDDTVIEELRQRFVETGFSKILVYKDSIDNIVGYVSSKDLFKHPKSLHNNLIAPIFVPETMAANRLLHLLLQEHKSMAIVVDEFGGTAGLVTIEDIMEVIFGEIEDEHDVEELVEKALADGEYVFSARLEVDYINERYPLNIPVSDEYNTLAGFVMSATGRIPKAGEKLSFPDLNITILKAGSTRVELLRIKRAAS
jgi:CBS domain containing-hemolysin-like protein